ncbi:sugar ABC transporter permease [Amylibacter ulvae]|uniref:Xylose transport system permease protein XylH n=1 Tax=Paramylibacter ulvae TaxID=1651968 RepID=A0ABQ3D5C5_9RHOB|nr:sugar ABC transporter permease [Amylibacter ulvae]
MNSLNNSVGADKVENEGIFTRFLRATEIDARLLGMIAALIMIWVGFHLYGLLVNGFGAFLTPRNLWNLSVQTASVAVMATGMVLVIVTRHIDLSVGSILGFSATAMAIMQVWILPEILGLGHPLIWVITVIFGLMVGCAIGAIHGYLIAYLGIPAFIVTLGGLLVWRGATFLLARGETIAPVDATFTKLGGGPYGAIGATGSWIVGLLACLALLGLLWQGRRKRVQFNFPQRPIWAETFLAIAGCAIIVGIVMLVNAYYWPKGIVRQYAEANNIDTPVSEIFISHGFAIPVLIMLAVGVMMTFLTTRTRFGRYVFAIGGNPEAAELAGIKTRWVTVKIFALMGTLCGLSAVIASARLGSASISLGTLDELYVIAAAVIGGTSFAGGVGTIYGAILGALLMQSLQAGMVLIGFDAAMQQMVVGSVLVFAVWIDTMYRRRAK